MLADRHDEHCSERRQNQEPADDRGKADENQDRADWMI